MTCSAVPATPAKVAQLALLAHASVSETAQCSRPGSFYGRLPWTHIDFRYFGGGVVGSAMNADTGSVPIH